MLALIAAATLSFCHAAPARAAIGIAGFDGGAFEQDGAAALAAGSHPYVERVELSLTRTTTSGGDLVPAEDLKDLTFHLPPGLIANQGAVPLCAVPDFPACPLESQVGVLTAETLGGATPGFIVRPLYLVEPPLGTAALLGAEMGVPLFAAAGLGGSGPGGLTITLRNANETVAIGGISVELWGVPADPSHDAARGECLESPAADACPSADAADPKAFLTLPTACAGPLATAVEVTGWQGGEDSATFLSQDGAEPPAPAGMQGCDAVPFHPSLTARPTTDVADSPTGLELDLHVPQEGLAKPGRLAAAHVRRAAITLPEGIAVNPAGANGLAACGLAEIGLLGAPGAGSASFAADPARCPDASRLGTVKADTPLLDHPLAGAVYLAAPHDNPFGSLLALYLVPEDPPSGTIVKLAARLDAEQPDGRLSIVLDEAPQLPLEDLRLHLWSGPHALLATPRACGSYSTASSITPWSAPGSGPPATPSDSFAIGRGPGGSCPGSAAQPTDPPSLEAGAVDPRAGASSPFVLTLRRADGTPRFGSFDLALPSGVAAGLRGVSTCPESALGPRPSCPPASSVGVVSIGAGAGPSPYFLNDGRAYLAGPYRGAPFSLAIVVPAVAGPFDLGTVLVRVAVYVDPDTGRLRLLSDSLPTQLAGIPLDLRLVRVYLDRPGFIRNPTSCDTMSIAGTAISAAGADAALAERFQVAGCGALPFSPKVALGFSGALTRNGHPALRAILRSSAEQAGIAAAAIILPPGELLDTRHLRALCDRELPPGRCPARSRLGRATIRSPLLTEPLRGPVFLRAPSHRYPDLIAEVEGGGVRLLLHGRTGATRDGRLRFRLLGLPDLPLSQATIDLAGGRRGIVVNSRTLCGCKRHGFVLLKGQNGKQRRARPPLKLAGCPARHRR